MFVLLSCSRGIPPSSSCQKKEPELQLPLFDLSRKIHLFPFLFDILKECLSSLLFFLFFSFFLSFFFFFWLNQASRIIYSWKLFGLELWRAQCTGNLKSDFVILFVKCADLSGVVILLPVWISFPSDSFPLKIMPHAFYILLCKWTYLHTD